MTGTAVRWPLISRTKRSSESRRDLLRAQRVARAAASSIARGIPSRRRQSAHCIGGPVQVEFRGVARARSAKSFSSEPVRRRGSPWRLKPGQGSRASPVTPPFPAGGEDRQARARLEQLLRKPRAASSMCSQLSRISSSARRAEPVDQQFESASAPDVHALPRPRRPHGPPGRARRRRSSTSHAPSGVSAPRLAGDFEHQPALAHPTRADHGDQTVLSQQLAYPGPLGLTPHEGSEPSGRLFGTSWPGSARRRTSSGS